MNRSPLTRLSRLAPVALAAVALLGGRADVARAADAPPAKPLNFAQQVVADLQIGPGIQSSQVILFPLWLAKAPEAPAVDASPAGSFLTYSEPDKPTKHDNVSIFNARTSAVLVAGGTILEGGKRDRMITSDHIVPPGATVEVEALPASTMKGIRKEAKPFRALTPLAPPFLREEAETSPTRTLVAKFVSHFLEFRNDTDERESLAAISETDKLAEYCLVCQRSMDKWPNAIQDGMVVGGIAVVRGRVQSFELFGSNALLKAYFVPILKSLSFPAAAVEIRAEKAGIPIPGRDNPAKTLELATKAANELLAKVKSASYTADKGVEGEHAEAFVLTMPEGIRGRAVGREGRLVHLSVFPNDPFEYGLYSAPLNPLSPEDIASDPDREGLSELARREALGARLTEAEKRLLERLRGAGGGFKK